MNGTGRVAPACLGILAVLGLACHAQAQTAPSWNGFYVGVNGGHAGSASRHAATPQNAWVGDVDWPAISTELQRGFRGQGFTGGVQAGFNLQMNNFVVGIEADANALHISNAYNSGNRFGIFGGTWNAQVRSQIENLVTLRARAGFATGQMLFFVTGGIAHVQTKFSQRVDYVNFGQEVPGLPLTDLSGGFNAGARSAGQFAGVLGFGVEYKLTQSFSLKGEFLHVALANSQRVTSTFVSPIDLSSYSIVHRHRQRGLNLVWAGLNYHF